MQSEGTLVHETDRTPGVTANARLTGMTGAVIFLLLAAEGITILRVDALVVLHVFIGMVLVPVALLKTATTTYRFVRYYRGDAAYVAKGAPPLVLRVLGPVVVLSTLGVLGTGIAVEWSGPRAHWLLQTHKLVFIAWFAVMTVHVLGHILETPALAVADLSSENRAAVPKAALRVGILVAALVAGVALGLLTRDWATTWEHVRKLG
jgi:hypothetical protein